MNDQKTTSVKTVLKRSTSPSGKWETKLYSETTNNVTVYRVTRLNEKLDHYGDYVSREFKKLETAEYEYQELAN